MNTITPHNDFFHQVMSRKENALAFFEDYAPESLKKLVVLNKLSLYESKHISDQGITRYNDVIYKCPAKGGGIAYLYCVQEHQSAPQNHMPLRLLEYVTFLIRSHLKDKHTKYPLVACFVFYSGKKAWQYSTKLSDYYMNKEAGEKILYMAPFNLISVHQRKEEEVFADPRLGFCFQAFRCVTEQDPYEALQKAMNNPMFREHFKLLPDSVKGIFFGYIGTFINKKKHSLEDLLNLTEVSNQEKERIMTSIVQHIEQRGIGIGMERGKAEGIQLGEKQAIEKLIKAGLISKVEVDRVLKKQK